MNSRWIPAGSGCAGVLVVVFVFACGSNDVSAAEPPTPAVTAAPGKALFDRWCAECHAPGVGHPGTQQLGWTRGVKLAVLEQRGDLTSELIRYVVRNGLAAMPAYRPTEITDLELTQLAGYLAPPKRTRR